ncbi:MAG TPA: dihydroneopterin aldolase [Cytophagaceae bacterium]|jgi:dihydroneopterin aldolase|nr:dihydroneopterin aldolase [Cytophagaceae bacterium]
MEAEIVLEGLEFYAYHGVYEQEQKIGNRFSVDIKILFDYIFQQGIEDLGKTVNYEKLYQCAREEMKTPSKLLETLAANIIERIFETHGNVVSVEVSVSKYNPPVGGRCERAKVTLKKKSKSYF